MDFADISALAAVDSGPDVLIARLDSPRGGQRYPIPDGVDLDKLSTLLLHCEKYSKLWGGAALR